MAKDLHRRSIPFEGEVIEKELRKQRRKLKYAKPPLADRKSAQKL